MKVRCLEGKGTSSLTEGKVYNVISEDEEYYTLENDDRNDGRQAWFKTRFEIVEEEKKVKRVRCINKGNNKLINVGEIYEIEKETQNKYYIKRNGYGLIDYNKNLFEEVKEDMKKSDIKAGMIAESREGNKYVVMESENGKIFVRDCGFMSFNSFDEDLLEISKIENLDIVKVFKVNSSYILKYLKDKEKDNKLTLIWRRKDDEAIKKVKEDIENAQKALAEAQNKLRELED